MAIDGCDIVSYECQTGYNVDLFSVHQWMKPESWVYYVLVNINCSELNTELLT